MRKEKTVLSEKKLIFYADKIYVTPNVLAYVGAKVPRLKDGWPFNANGTYCMSVNVHSCINNI